MLRFVLFSALVLLITGCERPFVEAETPLLEVVEPSDLSVVRTEAQLPLALRASSFRGIGRIEVNGTAATYLSDEEVYLDTLLLQLGLNKIFVDVFDEDGTVGSDTLYAAYLPFGFTRLPVRLPEPLGGHAATPLRDGTVLFTGGVEEFGGAAQQDVFRLNTRTFAAISEVNSMMRARAGHTASLLRDGRLLILGGSRRIPPSAPEDFLTEVEVYNPEATRPEEVSNPVPIVDANGEPAALIRRSDHTTTLIEAENGDTIVYLYGGLVPRFDGTSVVPTPYMRALRFETNPDRLVALGPLELFRFTALSGHTQTPLPETDRNGFGSYLVTGASTPSSETLRAPFLLTFAPSFETTSEAVSPGQSRRDHAAAPLRGFAFVTGGRADVTSASVLRTAEVFAPEPSQFFAFPEGSQPVLERWDHSATNLGADRILLVGGFSGTGEALDSIELFLPF